MLKVVEVNLPEIWHEKNYANMQTKFSLHCQKKLAAAYNFFFACTFTSSAAATFDTAEI